MNGGLPIPQSYYPRREEPEGGMVSEYVNVFRRHRTLIAVSALGGLIVSLLMGFNTVPLYTTRTSLDIRSVNKDFMDMRSVDPTAGNAGSDNDMNLQTQIKLLQSDTLIEQVATRSLSEPHPSSIPKEDIISKLERALHLGAHTSLTFEALVDDTSKRVKVKPIGLTRLVEISCESYDAKFAASFCNTLTNTFEEQDLETRSLEAQRTSEWLTHQVADIRLRAEESQRKLEQAMGGDGLMLSQTATASGEERLRSLQDELTKAEADRMQQEARSSVAHSSEANTVPSIQDDPEHRAYQLRLADLRSQLAQVLPTLTEANPKVIRLRSQIAEADAGLKRTEGSTASRQDNEFAAARHREALLQAAYLAQQRAVSSDLQKAAQVSLLRRELESEQQLYQTLLQKAKEAGFASALQATTIRVVDAAKVPVMPSSPRRKLAGSAGLALGLLFGTGLAFYRERNDTIFRRPGDVPRRLNVTELGVIPRLQRLEPAADELALTAGSGKNTAVTLTRWGDNFSVAAEAYRNITFSILLADTTKRSRSYVITSPSPGEGKTTVTSNLGVALSKSRLRVVLIDGDLRRPSLHRAFSVTNAFGLRNVLRGEVDLESVEANVLAPKTYLPNVSVIPSGEGSEDVVELLHSPHFGALLARLSLDFDIVLIDTPPILHMADARVMAGQSDGVILVLQAGTTSHRQAADARDVLDHDGVRLVGTVLNNYDESGSGGAYSSSYHAYGSSTSGEELGSAR
jgi:succinoglycan biosynthesis transport protein ExoP